MTAVPLPSPNEILPLEAVDPAKAEVVRAVNTALSDFKATGNRFYLYDVVGLCVDAGLTGPEPVQLFANRQVGRVGALLHKNGARDDIPDIFFGTLNAVGGRNAIRDDHDRQSVKALSRDVDDYSDAIIRGEITEGEVFVMVAAKHNLTPERARKKYKAHNRPDEWLSLSQCRVAYRALGTRDSSGRARLVVDIDNPQADASWPEEVPVDGYFASWSLPGKNS
jgi:hypothetical protein